MSLKIFPKKVCLNENPKNCFTGAQLLTLAWPDEEDLKNKEQDKLWDEDWDDGDAEGDFAQLLK